MKQWCLAHSHSFLTLIAARVATTEALRVVAKHFYHGYNASSKAALLEPRHVLMLAGLPAEILLLISYKLSVRDLCALEEVRSYHLFSSHA
jgi:hypothetical protein